MKFRTLAVLVVLAAVLIVWSVRSVRETQDSNPALGANIFPALDINRVHQIAIATTNRSLSLVKKDGQWRVAERFHYPAAFEKIVDLLVELEGMKVGQVLPADASQKTALNLADPSEPETKGTGTRLELRDEHSGLLAALMVGKPFLRQSPGGAQGPLGFGDYPDGRYLDTGDGRILLTSSSLDALRDDPKEWLDTDFINVPASDIAEIAVTGPGREPIRLSRPDEQKPFVLDGLLEEEGTLDSAKADRLGGALNYLAFDDVADPALPPKDTGLDAPVVFEAGTRDGRRYTLRVGKAVGADSLDRYVKAELSWTAPAGAATNAAEPAATNAPPAAPDPDKPSEANTAALNEKLSPWIYILKSYRAEPLLMARGELIKKPEPPKEDKPPEADAPKPAPAPAPKPPTPPPAAAEPAKSP